MKVIIRNVREPKVPTKEIRRAIEYYTSLLLTPRQHKNVVLTICFKEFEPFYKGHTEWLDRPVRPREFKITLSRRYKSQVTLRTLAHEMVHLQQFVLGELTGETLRSTIRWKHQEVDDEKIHYYDQPWEIEAFGKEVGLHARFIAYKNSLKR